jgi:hypothetical protein
MSDHQRRRAKFAKRLARFAAETGDDRDIRAAAALRGKNAGRPPVDDAAALRYAESLVDAGLVRSIRAACLKAATDYAPTNGIIRMTRRLQKKLYRK